MVQLRGEDLKPLPGIEIGDVGMMLGDNDTPVGYLILKGVRVPRRYLMEKRQHVSPEGDFVNGAPAGSMNEVVSQKGPPVDAKMAQALKYVSMMKTRIALASTAAGALAKGAVIASRYSCVRHQGFKGSGKDTHLAAENQIIDYGVQRQRVLRWTATAYAMKCATRWLVARRHEVEQGGQIDLADLPELHATSAGLKAVCCVVAADGIEDLRRSCGGHGYLMSSGIAPMEADFKGPNTTAEGDYVLLSLQTARFLMKCYDAARNGDKVEGQLGAALSSLREKDFSVARDGRRTMGCEFGDRSSLTSVPFLLGLFQYRAVTAIARAGEALTRSRESGLPHEESWNKAATLLYRAACSHVHFFIFEKFVASIKQCEDEGCCRILNNLAVVFALSNINDGEQWLGLLHYDEAVWAHELLEEACAALRPDAVALTDAFDFPDRVLNSTLGRSDGRVYEALLEEARRSGLNGGDEGVSSGVPIFVRALEDRLDKSVLAWRNGMPNLPARL